jgi:hypothetical protein
VETVTADPRGPLQPATCRAHFRNLGATLAGTCDDGGGAMGWRFAAPLARSWGIVAEGVAALGGGERADTPLGARTRRLRNSQDGETVVGPQWRQWPVAGVYTSIRGCNMKPLSLRPVL